MNRFRDFDLARAEEAGEPLTFRLGGKDFTVRAKIPAGPVLELAGKATLSDLDAIQAFGRFLFDVVVPEQADDFREALRGVDFAQLLELVTWIVEESTGRPFEKSSSSPAPPSPSGPPSRVVSLSAIGNHSE